MIKLKIILNNFLKILSLLFLLSCCSFNKPLLEKQINNLKSTYNIFGVIESFSPLMISGNQFNISKDLLEGIDNKNNYITSLKVGNYVFGQYEISNEVNHIIYLDKNISIIGPISLVSENQIVVLGQTINLLSLVSKEVNEYMPGYWVLVTGIQKNEGNIIATSIDLIPSQPFGYLRGKVSEINDKKIFIGSQEFSLRSPYGATVSGDIVGVKYSLKRDKFIIFDMQNFSNQFMDFNYKKVVIDGYVSKGDNKKLRISGFPFFINNSDFLEEGIRIVSKGKILPGSIFHIESYKQLSVDREFISKQQK